MSGPTVPHATVAVTQLYKAADAAWQLMSADRHPSQNPARNEEVREALRKALLLTEATYPNLPRTQLSRDTERGEGLTAMMEEE